MKANFPICSKTGYMFSANSRLGFGRIGCKVTLYHQDNMPIYNSYFLPTCLAVSVPQQHIYLIL
uniref:Uncharacterized protein n=1 Tax=Oryza brachyantha TaxID=4533 RepID=J3LFP1_ORYBR